MGIEIPRMLAERKAADDAVLHNPFPVTLPPGWSLYDVGLGIGWLTGLCVYLALGT